MRHGEYTVPETRGALAVYTNRKVDILARLARTGAITALQREAGYAFEATYHIVHGSPSSRDSTIRPVGGELHETETEAERWARANARTHTVLNRAGPAAYSALVSVAVFGEPVGRRVARARGLRAALTVCVVAYGMHA
jgi:hypothetical protein